MKRAAALGVVGLSLFGSSLALAQPAMEARDWRRRDRQTYQSPQRFAFELRFGPYTPEVDEPFATPGPMERVFGNRKGFYIGAEVDWQALRIPYFGTIGPGLGWGYTSRSANAKVSGTTDDSDAETSLTIMPMYLDAVLRIDVLARDVGIPLVPYGKLGLGFGMWSSSTDQGPSRRDGVLGRGRSWGTHMALGGMFLLDILDPSAALGFDEEVGVNNSYIFFEWQWANLDGQVKLIESGPQMHVGTSNWVIGLALEF
jgi:hypothetical protein